MRDWAEYSIAQADGGGASLAFSGRLVVSTVGPIDHELRDLETPLASVDLANVTEMDTVGAWIAWRIARDHGAQITGASETAARLIDAVKSSASDAEIAGFVRAVGQVARDAGLVAPGYRLLANTGLDSHQEVPHLHVHIFAGQKLGPMLAR